MTHLTVNDALEMPVVRNAGPVVVAAADALSNPLRWVHATELADIAPLLRPGDLVLMTGIALPESDDGIAEFARSLADVGAAGLMIELGRRWGSTLPAALIEACETHQLPLVTLTREVRFAAIIQAIGERVVDDQLTELRNAERVHDTFTELGHSDAAPRDILEAAQRLSGTAVVLENDHHQVLDYITGPVAAPAFLDDWAARSRRIDSPDRTTWDSSNGWLVTRLGTRDRSWGRLIVQSLQPPSHTVIAMAERAAAALAMQRLNDRHKDNLVRRTHHELLSAILTDPASADLHQRLEVAGLPLSRRQFVGVTMRPCVVESTAASGSRSVLDDALAAAVHAFHELGIPALVTELDRDICALVSLPLSASAAKVLDEVAARVATRHPVSVAVGRDVATVTLADRTLRESRQVVDAIRDGESRTVHRLEDVHVRGFLALLGDDERLRLFSERELNPLLDHDAESNDALVAALRAFLDSAGRKSHAAALLHLSRPAYYARLAKIERILKVDLDDAETRASLHVAVIARDLREAGAH